MTYEEMISDLVKLREHSMMPSYFKPTLNAILEYFAYEDDPKTTGWIPVSERLPEEGGEYLVTRGVHIYIFSYGIPLMPMNDNKGRRGWYEYTSEGDFYMNVDAWMPLPKPYREDGEV